MIDARAKSGAGSGAGSAAAFRVGPGVDHAVDHGVDHGVDPDTVERARSELEMSLNRFAFCLLIGLYVAAVGAPRLAAALYYIVGYFGVSILLFLHIRRHAAHNAARAMLSLAGDFTTISIEMHLAGGVGPVFYPIYLWVILGNGFRFGLRTLFVAMAAGLTGFGLVWLTTPFWSQQPYLSGGLLVGLVIVPAYGGTLVRKLSTARIQAEAGNRAKSLFLASVSHSVRTPLNAIIGSTALLHDTTLDPEQRELVGKLEIGSGILTSLLTGILDFMQIEAGRMPVRPARVDIATVLAGLRTVLAPSARAKGLKLFVHVDRDVPAGVLTDTRHLHEILLNLVSNAIKFTQEGSVAVTVTAQARTAGHVMLHVAVADTGIGIRPEAIRRIFDSFTQADSTILDRFGGTGLGLAITRRLVLLLGGSIAVDSTIDRGSVFSFTLDCPIVPEASPDAVPAAGRPAYPPLLLLAIGGGDVAARLARWSVPVEIVADAAGLGDRLATASRDPARRPVLVLDCPQAAARRDIMTPLLSAVDPLGDVPRLLVADAIDADEAGQLRQHVSSWIDGDFDPRALQAGLHACGASGGGTAAPSGSGLPRPARLLRILVADDNVTNQRLVAKILRRAGHHVHVVQNGEDAVIALTERPFDLALMDVNMPVMTGLEAAAEYRVLSLGQRVVPIAALTADATPEMARRCLEAGMIDCITKPVTPAALIARIDRLVPAGPAPAAAVEPGDGQVRHIQSHPLFRLAQPALDREVLVDLEALGGDEFVAEMLTGFVREADDIIAELDQAARTDDPVGFRNQAHGLRSAAANVGARGIQELCAQCREVPVPALRADGTVLARRLRTELGRVRQMMPAGDHAGWTSR